jgi:hypothetical protein
MGREGGRGGGGGNVVGQQLRVLPAC